MIQGGWLPVAGVQYEAKEVLILHPGELGEIAAAWISVNDT
jgi:hypothetical protein